MPKVTQERRLMNLVTPLGKDVLVIERLNVKEGLSQLFNASLEMMFDHEVDGFDPHIVAPGDVMGKPMGIQIKQDDGSTRYVNGLCVSFTQGNRNGRWTYFSAELVPKVWLLTQRSQSRIFQQKSVPDILKDVLSGFEANFQLQGTFEPRDYCVQYRETDWEFASRLMEEEGIYYYFDHTATTHQLIVANTPQSHEDCPTNNTIPFYHDISQSEDTGFIHSWLTDSRLRSGKVVLRDYSFEIPHQNLEKSSVRAQGFTGEDQLEVYDYPGAYAKRFDGISPSGGEQASNVSKISTDGDRTVKIRREELDAGGVISSASANIASLVAGHKFTLTNHPHQAINGQYVITSADIDAIQTPTYASDEPSEDPYRVSFECMAYGQGAAPFRPSRTTEKPVIYGTQTAVVVGPAGEEINVDKYGRVKVQFPWDRQGKHDSASSCWVRVAQPWSGNQWGTMFIPRIGMEVIVHFLEGDPDQPIITGCVYNAQNMPPYTLPDEKTKSTIKSNSSKGGGGYNEIRFEDKKGSEQIFIHGQKDEDVQIVNDCKESIGNDRHLTVGAKQYETIKSDKHLHVKADHKEKIDGAMSLQVGSNLQEKAGQKYAMDAGTEIHLKAGMKAVIEAGVQLSLKVGGNFIDINPAGISIVGTMVMINSGGAAGTGSGSSPDSPTDATAASDSQAGKAAEAPPSQTPPDKYSPDASTIQSAAVEGIPFYQASGGGLSASDREELLKNLE